MQVGDLVKIKVGWSLKGRMGVITEYVKKNHCPIACRFTYQTPARTTIKLGLDALL